jgi:hypothetical protein
MVAGMAAPRPALAQRLYDLGTLGGWNSRGYAVAKQHLVSKWNSSTQSYTTSTVLGAQAEYLIGGYAQLNTGVRRGTIWRFRPTTSTQTRSLFLYQCLPGAITPSYESAVYGVNATAGSVGYAIRGDGYPKATRWSYLNPNDGIGSMTPLFGFSFTLPVTNFTGYPAHVAYGLLNDAEEGYSYSGGMGPSHVVGSTWNPLGSNAPTLPFLTSNTQTEGNTISDVGMLPSYPDPRPYPNGAAYAIERVNFPTMDFPPAYPPTNDFFFGHAVAGWMGNSNDISRAMFVGPAKLRTGGNYSTPFPGNYDSTWGYTYTFYEICGGRQSVAYALNKQMHVAGSVTMPDGEHGFFWSDRYGMVVLPHLTGHTKSVAYAISPQYQVGGYQKVEVYGASLDASGNSRAVRWVLNLYPSSTVSYVTVNPVQDLNQYVLPNGNGIYPDGNWILKEARGVSKDRMVVTGWGTRTANKNTGGTQTIERAFMLHFGETPSSAYGPTSPSPQNNPQGGGVIDLY